MAGYSKTPLAKKLGVKPDFRILLINSPDSFISTLGKLPASVTFIEEPADELDMALLFCEWRTTLATHFSPTANRLRSNGMIWVCWYKKAAKIPTDLDENVIREFGLNAGMVDVKVCAIDEKWSGLKFVYRLKDRAK